MIKTKKTFLLLILLLFTNCSFPEHSQKLNKVAQKLKKSSLSQDFIPLNNIFRKKNNHLSYLGKLSVIIRGNIDNSDILKKEALKLRAISNTSELFECKKISEDKLQQIITCKRTINGILVKGDYIRFFIRKLNKHNLLKKIAMNWSNYPTSGSVFDNKDTFIKRVQSKVKTLLSCFEDLKEKCGRMGAW